MLVWLIALCCLTGETRGQMIRKYIENNYLSHYTDTLALAGSTLQCSWRPISDVVQGTETRELTSKWEVFHAFKSMENHHAFRGTHLPCFCTTCISIKAMKL